MMRISKLLCKSFALLSLLFIACSNTDDIQQKVTEIDASQLKVRDPFIFYDADTDYYYLAYARTEKGISYGDPVLFATSHTRAKICLLGRRMDIHFSLLPDFGEKKTFGLPIFINIKTNIICLSR